MGPMEKLGEVRSSSKIFSSKPEPTVSVVIPAFNCERFIGHALDSIHAQSCRPDKIIVVDDGSTDRTANMVEDYCFTEDRLQSYLSLVGRIFPDALEKGYRPDSRPVEIVLLRQENKGPSAARNLGGKHSRGDWITFLDADDLWTPMTIEILLEVTRNAPQSSFVFGDGLNFMGKGKVLGKVSSDHGGFFKGIIDGAFDVISKENPIVNGGAILVRRELILKAGGFREDISHGEDHDLWLKLALFTQLACTDDVVLLRRRRAGALSENQEAFYKARPRIFSDIEKTCNEQLIVQGIDIGKHINASRYSLAYFYYLQGMPFKAMSAAAKWVWGCFAGLLRQRKFSRRSKNGVSG